METVNILLVVYILLPLLLVATMLIFVLIFFEPYIGLNIRYWNTLKDLKDQKRFHFAIEILMIHHELVNFREEHPFLYKLFSKRIEYMKDNFGAKNVRYIFSVPPKKRNIIDTEKHVFPNNIHPDARQLDRAMHGLSFFLKIRWFCG